MTSAPRSKVVRSAVNPNPAVYLASSTLVGYRTPARPAIEKPLNQLQDASPPAAGETCPRHRPEAAATPTTSSGPTGPAQPAPSVAFIGRFTESVAIRIVFELFIRAPRCWSASAVVNRPKSFATPTSAA